MFEKKIPRFVRAFQSLGGKKVEKEKKETPKTVDEISGAFKTIDEASSNYGVAALSINSVPSSKSKLTTQQVEKILKEYLKNDKYEISCYSELFSNLDKLDYENIDRHIENIKKLFNMRANFPNNIIKNGYFYSEEGAQAFEILASILSDKSMSGYVAPLSIALYEYNPSTVLILQKRGLLTKESVDNSHRLSKLAKMNDEEYSSYQQRVDESIKSTGLSFEKLAQKVKQKTKGLMNENSYDFFQSKCINEESVVAQLEVLKVLEDYPVEIKDFNLASMLNRVDINNVESFINTLNKLKTIEDISVQEVLSVLSFTNEKNEKIVLEILSDSELPISKIIEYLDDDEKFVDGVVSSKTMIDRIKDDSFLKTIKAIKNTSEDLVPTNTKPTELNPRKIESSALALVHMTKYPPEKDMLLSTRDKLGGSRNSVHFTLNHAVSTHRGGCWEEYDYAIIMPYDSTVNTNGTGKFIEGMPNDIYTNGSVKIPKGAVIVKYNPDIEDGTIKVSDYPDIAGVKCIESSQYPHCLVPTVLEKMGYSHLKGDGPMGFFSYGKDNGNNLDDAILNYSAWKDFCDSHDLKATRHTGCAGDIAEKVVENVGKLCVHNSWGKKDSYRKELLYYLDVAKDWTSKGYFVSYDIDEMTSLIKEASTPKVAVEKMKEKLGFHPTIEYDYFNDCTFSIPIDIYEEWHKMSNDLVYMKNYIKEHEL